MHRLLYLLLLLLTACQLVDNNEFTNGVQVDNVSWEMQSYNTSYPFTTYGEIVCSLDEVYFYPEDTGMNESHLPLPLNELARDTVRTSNVKPTVENTIKPDADLTDAIRIGLDNCKANNYQRPTKINK